MKNVSEYVIFLNIFVVYILLLCRICREIGIVIRVIRRLVMVMLINRKLVSDFVFGFFLMMKIRRRFLIIVINMVIEYSIVKIVLCRELGLGDCFV